MRQANGREVAGYGQGDQHRILRLIPHPGGLQCRTDCRATAVQHVLLCVGRVYRRLDHGRAQNNLRAVLGQLSPSGENFARTFIDLQEQRQEADYNPNAQVVRSDTINIIERAQTAIRDFARLSRAATLWAIGAEGFWTTLGARSQLMG